MMRFAPKTRSRYWLNVRMYSWRCGSCLSKPADIRSWTAKTPMIAVSATRTARVAARCANRIRSSHATSCVSSGSFAALIAWPSVRSRPPDVAASAARMASLERIGHVERQEVPVLQQIVSAATRVPGVCELAAPPVQIFEIERRRNRGTSLDERYRVRAGPAEVVGDVDLRSEVHRRPQNVRIDHGQFAHEPG